MTPWHLGPMLGFDLETTGVDVETDRVVTAAAADLQPGQPPGLWHQMCDHDAAQDCLAACRVAWRIGCLAHMPTEAMRRAFADRPGWQFKQPRQRLREVAEMPLMDLHWAQARWRAEQAESLEEYLRRTDEGARVDPWWPVRPFEVVAAT